MLIDFFLLTYNQFSKMLYYLFINSFFDETAHKLYFIRKKYQTIYKTLKIVINYTRRALNLFNEHTYKFKKTININALKCRKITNGINFSIIVKNNNH